MTTHSTPEAAKERISMTVHRLLPYSKERYTIEKLWQQDVTDAEARGAALAYREAAQAVSATIAEWDGIDKYRELLDDFKVLVTKFDQQAQGDGE